MLLRRRGLLAGMLAAGAPMSARAAGRDPALWVVERGRAKVYLFGEGPPYVREVTSPKVAAALANSAVLWKEVPPIAPADGVKFVGAHGVDRTAPLTQRLAPADSERLPAAALAAGLPLTLLQSLRPWAAAMLLQGGYYPRVGLQAAFRDAGVTAAASTRAMPIHYEMGDAESALRYFASFTPAAETDFFRWVLNDIESGVEAWRRRGDAWAAGDLRLEEGVVELMRTRYPALHESHLVGRNAAWLPRIETMLDDGGATFVMVGLDHLTGPDSVQRQLAAHGLRPRRL